ncbi:MAG: hypothetical protein ACTSSH_07820 [Candidatus Heimdallarchaeota archaeon]
MVEYNVTHPLNYTQQDFDEVKIEFSLKMKLISTIVQSTSVYDYNANQLHSDVTNNYTYMGENYLIINQWFAQDNPHMVIHEDIREYVNMTFTLAGDPLDLPEIRFEKWTYHLYNNLSILEFVGASKSIGYFKEGLADDIGLSLVNLSLTQVADYRDGYITLIEKTNGITQDLNNTLITLALSAVLMGFSISFDTKNYQKVSMIVGFLVLLLSIVYFSTAMGSFAHLASFEAKIIGINDFVFI